jgi:hypothetical protein
MYHIAIADDEPLASADLPKTSWKKPSARAGLLKLIR